MDYVSPPNGRAARIRPRGAAAEKGHAVTSGSPRSVRTSWASSPPSTTGPSQRQFRRGDSPVWAEKVNDVWTGQRTARPARGATTYKRDGDGGNAVETDDSPNT